MVPRHEPWNEERAADGGTTQGVFTYLVDNLGVKNVQFEELIALDADFLKQQG